MREPDDHELLGEFSRNGSEAAFATLVARHVNLVHSAALRFTGNSHHAEEITQAVFIILARKAGKLSSRVVLSGWLYQVARLTAANFVKGEIRRQRRQQEAYMQSTLDETESSEWKNVAPLLDEAMGSLGKTDRDAVVLRYFENKTAAEIGAALRMNEETARRRVNRAVEKLRKFFTRRNVVLPAVILTAAISANSVKAAPVALAKSVTAMSIAKGAAAGSSTLTLIKGALKIMAWTKAKTAIVVGAGVLLAVGTATITIKEFENHKRYSWEVLPANSETLYKVPPQVVILPTKFPSTLGNSVGVDDQALGISMEAKELILQAYRIDELRTVFATELPASKYDYIANLKSGSGKSLQREIEKQLGITGRFEAQSRDTLALTFKDAHPSKLTPRKSYREQAGMWFEGDRFRWAGQPTSRLADWLERYFKVIVIDQTGMTNLGDYNFDLNWNERDLTSGNSGKLKQALSQMGFELIPTNQPVDILIIEKAK